MKAVLCRAHGAPESLEIGELPTPTAGDGEVLVEVHAASVNYPDVLMVAGKYQSQPPMPFAPGSEVGGIVRAVGAGITDLAPGDRVMASTGSGGFAEYAVVRRRAIRKIPAAMDLNVAAAIGVTYGTSYHALRQRGNLQPGETLLVTGAAGGVGLAAVELGKAMGARVIACASSQAKLAAAKAAGADEVIDYSSGNIRDQIKDLTGGKGIDVCYDAVGGPLFDQLVRSMAWNGRLLIIGFVGGDIPKVAVNLLLLKGAAAIGVFYGSFAAREPVLDQQNFAEMFGWIEAGTLKPLVSKVYPFTEYAAAMNALAHREVIGKVVLQVRA